MTSMNEPVISPNSAIAGLEESLPKLGRALRGPVDSCRGFWAAPGPWAGLRGQETVPAPGSQRLRTEEHVGPPCRQAELFGEVGSGRALSLSAQPSSSQQPRKAEEASLLPGWLSGKPDAPRAGGAGAARLACPRAMLASLTEGSPDPEEPTQTPGSHAVRCLPTSSPDGVEDDGWGSFYHSFKVSVCLPSGTRILRHEAGNV